jgi:hypothetical protein
LENRVAKLTPLLLQLETNVGSRQTGHRHTNN